VEAGLLLVTRGGEGVLIVDGSGAVISYEEYYPYGSTSYQSGRSAAEVSLKRYRYTGKERDEETGLYYHGARYYASWLGRWTSCDPAGFVDGLNLYAYVRNNSVRLIDPTGTQSDPTEADYGLELMQKISVEVAVKVGVKPPTPEEQKTQRKALAPPKKPA
jgi:RHS repeat-associated protein